MKRKKKHATKKVDHEIVVGKKYSREELVVQKQQLWYVKLVYNIGLVVVVNSMASIRREMFISLFTLMQRDCDLCVYEQRFEFNSF